MGEALILGALGLLVGLACLVILVFTLLDGPGITMDNLLLMAICLALGGVFSSLGAALVRSAQKLRAAGAKAPPPAAPPTAAAASSSKEVQRPEETKVG